MPASLLDRLKRISSFANEVADEIVYEETEILEKTIPQMFKVMQTVAGFACDYVRRGRFGKRSPGLGYGVADDHREDVGRSGPPGED